MTGGGRRALPRLAGPLALVALLGCGASPRMVHQSSYYFERCHAADLDEQRTLDERQACWAAWLRHWSAAQPPVRVRYAEQRVAALSRGETVQPLPHARGEEGALASDASDGQAHVLVEAGNGGGPPRVELAAGAADEPSSTAEASEGEAEDGSESEPDDSPDEQSETTEERDPVTPRRPGPPPPPVRDPPPAPPPRPPIEDGTHPCTELCNPKWDVCVRRCSDRGQPCFAACRSEYRICTRACR